MFRVDSMNTSGDATSIGEDAGGQNTGAQHECSECPLHITMQHLTRAAVSQLVYYADGEYAPRPNLLHELERWQRLHALIATRICPASRQGSSTTADVSPADLNAVQELVPEAQFTALREMMARCAARQAGDACPIERESHLEPFSEW